jgi:signal peptidase II
MRRLANLYWLWLAVLIVILDIISKQYAVRYLILYQPLPLLPHINLLLAHNSGAAFSFLGKMGGWQRWLFVGVALIMCNILMNWLLHLPKRNHLLAAALALILGGAIGNLWDRLQDGYVIDFIDFYFKTWHFATFNIADVAITAGAILLIISSLLKHKN